MKLSLTRVQRSLLLFLSACGYTAWFSGLDRPLGAQGVDASPAPVFTLLPEPALPRVDAVVARNPFAGDATSSPASLPVAERRAADRPDASPGAPNVPDIGTDGAEVPAQGPALVVRATIVGPSPVAYIANGSAMDIVRVGDELGDRRIRAIDLRGIAFNDGSRLDLPQTPGLERTPAQPHTITLGIDDLRRLLLPAARVVAPSPSPAPASLAATPSPVATDPTAGPMPTVDARGLPVGVNPTSNPSDPTPMPYPYPYAPVPRH